MKMKLPVDRSTISVFFLLTSPVDRKGKRDDVIIWREHPIGSEYETTPISLSVGDIKILASKDGQTSKHLNRQTYKQMGTTIKASLASKLANKWIWYLIPSPLLLCLQLLAPHQPFYTIVSRSSTAAMQLMQRDLLSTCTLYHTSI